MGEIKLDGYICERCAHTWVSRNRKNRRPLVCPKCKTAYWNIPRKNVLKKQNYGLFPTQKKRKDED